AANQGIGAQVPLAAGASTRSSSGTQRSRPLARDCNREQIQSWRSEQRNPKGGNLGCSVSGLTAWSTKQRLVSVSSISSTAVRSKSRKCATTRSLVQSRPAIPAWSKLTAPLSEHVLPPFQRE